MAYIFEVNGLRNVRIIENGRNIFENDKDALAIHAITITFVANSTTIKIYDEIHSGSGGSGGSGEYRRYHYETVTFLSWASTAPLYWDILCTFAGMSFKLKTGKTYGTSPSSAKYSCTNACKKIAFNGNNTTKVLSHSIARQSATYNIIETRLCIE